MGETQANDVAFDIDGDVEEDPDALDSDEEELLNEELGIDVDESESRSFKFILHIHAQGDLDSTYARGPSILPASQRQTNACISASADWASTSRRCHKRRGNFIDYT